MNYFSKIGISRTVILSFAFAMISQLVYSQCTISTSTSGTSGTSSGSVASIATIYDPGGTLNYPNSSNVTVVYTAPAGKVLKITFTSFNTENTFDYVFVYNGPSTSSPALSPTTGLTGVVPTNIPTLPTYTTTGTTLTVKFTSDNTTVRAGYVATVECIDVCANTTSGGTISGTTEPTCGSYDPSNITSTTAASGGSGTLSYQWESSLNNSTWADISGATLATYDHASVINQTTYFRRKSKNSGCTIWGVTSNTITKTVNTVATANAGADQTQCYNGVFQLIANNPLSGQTGAWSVVSGTALTNNDITNDSIFYTIPSGGTATLRWKVTSGACEAFDDVVITNTTSCATNCTSPINANGDLENEGNATNFNLTFQGTPAQLLNDNNTPFAWVEGYGTGVPNSTTFTGGFYIKKTGVNGNPKSGSHMMYLSGNGYCYSALRTTSNINCGKTYRISVWIAAYSNNATQANSNISLEAAIFDWQVVNPTILKEINIVAPASTSWNSLNWQRYTFDITVPTSGYESIDVYFTPSSAVNGVVIDDVCITEVTTGSFANAGSDILNCSNSFTMSANAPASGFTGTWSVVSGSATIASVNSPTSTVTISSGTTATLRWTVNSGTCTSSDDAVIAYTNNTISVNNSTICSGGSTTLTASGCSGSLLWSTGATTSSITVSPTSTTSYSITCTPTPSANLIQNPNFESATDMQNWDIWQNAAITTVPSEVYAGTKALKVGHATTWGGSGQSFAVIPGQLIDFSAYVKTDNVGANGEITLAYYNSAFTINIMKIVLPIDVLTYSKITSSTIVPAGAAFLQISFGSEQASNVFADNVSVTATSTCSPVATGTVTVINSPITLGVPTVSSVIDHPLTDVVTVDVVVSWVNPPSGQKIKITANNKTKYIDVPSGVTSPQTIRFTAPANGTSNNAIVASWESNIAGCSSSVVYSTPSPISNPTIACNILYLCGLDKPWDGYPFDHGMIDYLDLVSTGTITPVLTKNETGLGFYDPNVPSTPLSISLSNYQMIVVSPTTEGHLSSDLKNALAAFTGSVLNMNYEATDELGMTAGSSYYNTGQSFATSSTVTEQITDYGNVNPTYSYLMTGGDYKSNATAGLWFNTSSVTSNLGGIFYKYLPHTLAGVSSTVGTRVFFGLHMNGIYANAQNGAAIPVPASYDFVPTNHLTLKGKQILDNVILSASTCATENCTNGIDDDGDGLADCADPDCSIVLNGEFDNSTTNWAVSNNVAGNSSTFTVDNTNQLTGKNSAKIDITAASGTEWHIQFLQVGRTIQAGKKYTLSFRAKASANRNISTAVDLGSSPYTTYFYQTLALTTAAQNYSYTFTASTTVTNNARILFNLAASTGIVYIDQVFLREACGEICNNGIDDDGDGFVDALDTECNTCSYVGQNLITNGEFDSGNTGFTSDYIFTSMSNMCGNYGIYGVGSRISQVGAPLGCNFGIWSVADRANTGGNFMLIDPSAATGVNDRIWAQTITVCPNTDYVFSVWTKNMYYSEATGYSGVDPNFEFKINGSVLPGANFVMPRQPKADSIKWIKVQGTWNSGSSTTASLNIVNKIPGAFGNDLAIDGLFFGLCGKISAITAATTNFCTGSSTTITATAQTTTSGWSFYEWLKDGVVVSSGASATSYVATTAGTYKLRTYTTSNNTGCPNESNNIVITTTTTPTISGTTPASRCGTGSVTLGATSSAGTINWYAASTGGTSLGTGTSFTTPSISTTTTYYVDATNAGCTTATRTAVVATVNSIPTISTTAPASRCGTGTVTLGATASAGTINWYAASTGGTSLGTGTSFTTPSISTTTTYYVDATNTGCTTATRTAVTATVTTAASISTTTPASICGTGTVTLGATASGGTLNWYAASTGGASLGTGTSFTTPSISTTTTYYVDATVSGCTTSARSAVVATVNSIPTISGTTPASICGTGTVTLGATASAGTINWYAASTGGTSLGTGTSFTTPSISTTTTYYVDATNTGCTTATRTAVVATVNSIPTISTTALASRCGTGTVILGATASAGTINWYAASTGGTSLGTGTSFTTPSISTTTTYYVDATNTGCTTASRTAVVATVTAIPTIATTTPASRCGTGTVTLGATASAGTISWYAASTGGTSLGSGTSFTTPSISTTTTYYAEAVNGSCISTSRIAVVATIGTNLTATIDYNGSVCLKSNSVLTANTSSGTAPFIYSWTGPSGFTGNTQNVNITANGNYALTITDNLGCSGSTTGFVYSEFVPAVVSVSTTVCEGDNITLTASGTNATSYLWSSNASNATTAAVTVTPGLPSSTYIVTVTNNLGCTASVSSTINVTAKPTVTISGGNTICQGFTTTLSPTTGGTWSSTNPTVASITNAGVVTGLSAGTATFVFRSSATTCSSNASAPITVNGKPIVSVTGPSSICKLSTTQLSPTTGGTWVSNNPTIASVTNAGVVTGLDQGTATFTFTNSSTGCVSNATTSITVDNNQGSTISGSNTVCVGSTTTLTVSGNQGGTWASSNTSIATINASGVITGVSSGNAIMTYSTSSGSCSNQSTYAISVNPKIGVNITGANIICGQATTQLSPTTGGTWVSNNTTVASVTNAGLVTGLTAGTATFTFTSSAGCASDATPSVTVNAKPVITVPTSAPVCLGNTIQLTVSPSSVGTWASSNNAIATISNTGLVSTLAAGNVTFTYTNTTTGCVSNSTSQITIVTKPSLAMDYNGSVCLTNTSKLGATITGGTAPFNYTWTGPSGFTGNTALVNIINNGNYALTVVDASGCSANTTGFVYEKFDPLVVSLNSTICEGNTVNLNANGTNVTSYLWSANANNATTSGVTVTPVVPSSTYYVTITNSVGCTAVTNATIAVNAKPVVTVTGGNGICIGGTTTLTPNTGGTWVSNNPSIASVTNAGLVTGLANGTATFVFTNSTTNCQSNPSSDVIVNNSPITSYDGPANICINGTTNLLPSTGGTWTSNNPSIASVTNSGLVTGLASGVATFVYTSSLSSCSSATSGSLTVSAKPNVSITGSDVLCISDNSQLFPTSGGTWASNNTAVATVQNDGKVTAISAGTVTFTFTNSTGCASLPTLPITVNPRPTITYSGPTSACVGGTSSISPTTGGLWTSSNPAIATISNNGTISAVSAGSVTFIFTNSTTSCSSSPSAPFSVNAKPLVSITGSASLCIGSNSTLSPTSGGTWVSNNTAVATVQNNGVVTAVSVGTTTFTFTSTLTGCISNNTSPISVYAKPTINNTGPSTICIGGSTTLTPASGGSWSSSNPAVASINSSGIVIGLSPGTATFTFTEAGSNCISDASAPITVGTRPIVTISGPTSICVSGNTTLSPSTGGTWISNNPTIASVTNAGVVTGLSQGTATFTYVSASGCSSNPTQPITINGKPNTVFVGTRELCVGGTTTISPAIGGTWISNQPAIATINNQGVISAISSGQVAFVFTDQNTGCVSEASALLTVNEIPDITNLGTSIICVGLTTQLAPTTGGIWSTSNPTATAINNNGLVFGLAAGTATFTYTNSTTGCVSNKVLSVTVNPKPAVSITGPTNICIGSTTTLSPTTGGTWISKNPTIASVTNAGVVTGLIQGLARFEFTNSITGCVSANTAPVQVNGKPTTSVAGQSNICIGGTTQLSPNSGGTWVSLNPTIATVANNGVVTGVSIGLASFVFTDLATGCTSNPDLTKVTVSSPAPPSIVGTSIVCLGYQTTLSPSTGVIWASSNPKIASVTNDGVVTGLAPGKVSFTYTLISSGCSASLPADAITVKSCVDPDFNVTLVNVQNTGNVSTNDDTPAGTTFGPPILVSKPSGSISNLVMNTNGTYTFTANTKGQYNFNVPVCILPLSFGCPFSNLTITVIDPLESNKKVVANLDMTTVYTNGNIWMNASSNDKCLNNVSCDVNINTMWQSNTSLKGFATLGTPGGFVYTPHNLEVGLDTIVYNICATGEPSNCTQTKQYVTINALNALNSTVASDDFFSSFAGTDIVGNVMTNDSDPENNTIAVVPQGSPAAKITIPQGKYYITSGGQLVFTPNTNFSGPLNIIYTLCDNHPTSPTCASATAHLLVLGDLSLSIRVYLEGALMQNGDITTPEGKPMMRDDLRANPFDGKNLIPAKDPYKFGTEFVTINNKYTYVTPGNQTIYNRVTDSVAVFSVTGRDAIVDWVFIELRSKSDNKNVVATRSGLLQRDGDVVDIDGTSSLKFAQTSLDSFYVVVRHRNHLGVMSKLVANGQLVDFTSPNTPVFDFGTTHPNGKNYTGLALNSNTKFGYRAMWAGDFDANRKLKFTNPGDDQNVLFFDVFSSPDNTTGNANYNNAIGYFQGDFNMNGKSKYDNPNDDKNLLFSQILLYELNTQYLSNFDFFIEQVP